MESHQINPQDKIKGCTFNTIKFLTFFTLGWNYICVIFALVSCVLFCKHAAFNWCNFPYNFPLLLFFPFWIIHPRVWTTITLLTWYTAKILFSFYIANCAKSTDFQGGFMHNRKRESFQEGLSEMIASHWFPSITSNRFCVKPLNGFQLIAFNRMIIFAPSENLTTISLKIFPCMKHQIITKKSLMKAESLNMFNNIVKKSETP